MWQPSNNSFAFREGTTTLTLLDLFILLGAFHIGVEIHPSMEVVEECVKKVQAYFCQGTWYKGMLLDNMGEASTPISDDEYLFFMTYLGLSVSYLLSNQGTRERVCCVGRSTGHYDVEGHPRSLSTWLDCIDVWAPFTRTTISYTTFMLNLSMFCSSSCTSSFLWSWVAFPISKFSCGVSRTRASLLTGLWES